MMESLANSLRVAKRPQLDFEPPKTPTEFPRGQMHASPPSPLSPSKVTTTEQNATISGLLACLSPIKPSRYFDGELTDGDSVIRLVGFDKHKQQQLKSFCDYKIPVTLRNCLIQHNKFKNTLEIVIKNQTKIESSVNLMFQTSEQLEVTSLT